MPAKRDAQQRRREAILEIVRGSQPIGQQQELVDQLRARGIPATQSSVSRDLQNLGVIRPGEHYILPDWVGADSPFKKAAEFVESARPAGPHTALLATTPGAGAVVAGAIDSSAWDGVVGTVAGSNSVLVLTENVLGQKLLFARLKQYLGEEEDPGREGGKKKGKKGRQAE